MSASSSNRYENSPVVFAGELCDEPRCMGDDNRGASVACGRPMLTSWIENLSSFIKPIDSAHMVTVGDEGWFTPAQNYGDAYPYQGTIGIDWVTNPKISTIDYGTFHMYPVAWGQADSRGNTWIQQHAEQGAAVGKLVVLEEFGTTNVGSRYSIVGGWLDTASSNGLNGIQYWQFVGSFPSGVSSLFSLVLCSDKVLKLTFIRSTNPLMAATASALQRPHTARSKPWL
jgi:mannan endo-1,4-beta-mannosidase